MFWGSVDAIANQIPFPSKLVNRKLKVYPKVNPLIKSINKINGVPKIVNPNKTIAVNNIKFFFNMSNNKILVLTC